MTKKELLKALKNAEDTMELLLVAIGNATEKRGFKEKSQTGIYKVALTDRAIKHKQSLAYARVEVEADAIA